MKLILRLHSNFYFLFFMVFGCCFHYISNEEAISHTSINTSVENVDKEQGHHSVEAAKHFVQSSFEEGEQTDHMKDYIFSEAVSQNAGISNGIYDTSQSILTTFVDPSSKLELEEELIKNDANQNQSKSTVYSNIELNSHADNIDKKIENTGGNAETGIGNKTSEDVQLKQSEAVQLEQEVDIPKEELLQLNVSDEEIPSFSEWTQKQLEEAEKKENINNSAQSNGHWNNNNSNKVRSKNYASPDCGAKVISNNPEAGSPNNVLTPNTDEYILNTCTSRIWFVVELCEPMQAKKIEIGNFELFSSTPKEFTISVSDRYSSREWAVVGQFTAADERKLQAFELQPHLFGRFIKFEMHSHYGAEHYCPISMLRVYGTTEFEVLEKETHSNPIDYEDIDDLDNEDEPAGGNLFSSATDAVIKMVNKAREVLGNKGNNSNQTTEREAPLNNYSSLLVTSCKTPSHIVVCNNCSDLLFGYVYELLSCNSNLLGNLLKTPLIKNTIYNSDICNSFGIDFRTKRTGRVSNVVNLCVQAFFPPRYLAAFCNTVAIIENQVVLNTSKNINITSEIPLASLTVDDIVEVPIDIPETASTEEVLPTTELKQDAAATALDLDVIAISYTLDIQPTKTFIQAEPIKTKQNMSTDYNVAASNKSTNDVPFANNATVEQHFIETTENVNNSIGKEDSNNISSEVTDFDFVSVSNQGDSSTPSPMPPIAMQGKESVFIKLSNRIKVLERNMSLSSQYLEELSRRYKKQVEEMQKMIDKTISTLHEEGISKDMRIQRLEEKINTLIDVVDLLATEKNQWLISSYWFLIIVVVVFVLLTCCQRNELNKYRKSAGTEQVHRRKSIGVVNHNLPTVRVRRPSEEASIISGSYQHLMIDNVDLKKKLKDRKRKKKNSAAVIPNGGISREFDNKEKLWLRQESAPPNVLPNWNNQLSTLHNTIQDIPFVLEESDHSPLEGMPLPKPLRDINSHSNTDSTVAIENLPSLTYIQTATQSRSNRNFNPDTSKHKVPETHRKSASVDETRRQKSPAPSTGNVSLNINFNESSDDKLVQKKQSRLLPFKKIFSRKLDRKEKF